MHLQEANLENYTQFIVIMHPKLVHTAAVLLIALAQSTGAFNVEDIQQCVEQLSAKLLDVGIPPRVKDLVDKVPTVSPEEVYGGYDLEFEFSELDPASCRDHMNRFYYATEGLACHQELAHSVDYAQLYIKTMLDPANRITRDFLMGATICQMYMEQSGQQ